MARVPINLRILTSESWTIEVAGDPSINLSDDTVFQFLSEEFEGTPPVSSIDENEEDDEDKEKEFKNESRSAENDLFWKNQHQLLQSVLRRTTSLESRIRSVTKEAVKEAQSSGNICTCNGCGPSDNGCRKCLMEAVCDHLKNAGFDSAICKSKWKSSPDIPSGEHMFLDVIDNCSNSKKETRVIIELNFRGEFEMARSHEEYNKLAERLPKIFVGKIERLLELLKIVCGAAKKCMKEKKMHMGPWRKHQYMQAKWQRTCERMSAPRRPLSGRDYSGRPARATVSLLSVDIMENFSTLLGTAVAVV